MRSPRRNVFLDTFQQKHGPRAEGGPDDRKLGQWAPNPTFHKAVRKSVGNWFGAGALQLDSHTSYLEARCCEQMQPPPPSFLLRRRPDVLAPLPWTAMLERGNKIESARKTESEGVEAMLTARRAYVHDAPLHTERHSRSNKRLDPHLLPTGEPGVVQALLQQATSTQATQRLGSPYAVDLHDMLAKPKSPRTALASARANQTTKPATEDEGAAAASVQCPWQPLVACVSRADTHLLPPAVPKTKLDLSHTAPKAHVREPKYFHAEYRGKGAPIKATRTTTTMTPPYLHLSTSGVSGGSGSYHHPRHLPGYHTAAGDDDATRDDTRVAIRQHDEPLLFDDTLLSLSQQQLQLQQDYRIHDMQHQPQQQPQQDYQHLVEHQHTQREGHARQLTRRVTALPAWTSVQVWRVWHDV